jgi:hypothetical protein
VAETPVTIMETKAEERWKIEEQPKMQDQPQMVSAPAGTPRKGKRMANVLEAVLRPTKMAPSTTPKMAIDVEITPSLDVADPSGSVPTKLTSDNPLGKEALPIAEVTPIEDLEYIVRHASGKKLSKEQIAEVQHYARDLRYPWSSIVYGENDEDDYFYCLLDDKEIDVCHEMMDTM